MLPPHLTVLQTSARRFGPAPAFRTPRLDADSDFVESWDWISYEQFYQDVELSAKHWTQTLSRKGIPQRSVVGMWLSGFTYMDVLHIYGVSRAGYIPQMFSLRLPNPTVIFELLHKAQAKALICDDKFTPILDNCPVPYFLATRREAMVDTEQELPELCQGSADDTAFIFHTSGSTSGSPKLVPCNNRWINTVIHKSRQISKPRDPNRQDVTVWMGSMCHIAQSFMFIGSLQYGACVVQPTTLSFSSDELASMIQHCGLNRLNQFATFLTNHFRYARSDPKLLGMLQGLDDVLYSGLPLSQEEENWARRNEVKLRNLFGSTECAAMLMSSGDSGRTGNLLTPLDGVVYNFVPISQPASPGGHQSTARLFELVIMAESPDCPDVSLRHADGNFHTGDLFQEAAPGMYLFRGRDDDWIKTENSLRCDTKAIEDNVRMTCGDLISECVVVGSRRPSPAMFVEPANAQMNHDELKKSIIRKTRHFHSRRYMHERITASDMIVVVPPGTLPRTATKGNIRRKAVEEAYKPLLDQIYGRVL
ncbi:hypothetical protein AMATHDRAFT_145280 [Amanita thiersii Skay4041]|uniref:AMP-dependent synthetase/ligase domain-containing protein n=1 Tax=Amanita thiersii Skay4041 TaxID=703135 RepID=A0A2A9NRU5_9AGAR|nr:hypothetical protein AMATHDRAFT_145280 [Amanita thiersii Skay4041]